MNLDRIIAVRNNKTVYHDGDLCLKVFDENYSKADVLNEALNQARVEETGLNIPKVREVTVIEGRWAIVSDYIKGKTLARLIQEHHEKKGEYLNAFVDLQLEMHAKTCPLLNRLKDVMSRKIIHSDFDATTRYDLYNRLDAMPKHDKLCHGDFNLDNIILTDDGVPYILDWAHATRGNASADAARTYLCFWLSGDIDGAKKYLDLFCEKSDTALPYVQRWMPLVAAEQSVYRNEKQREFLRSWVEDEDYKENYKEE
ncbi:MAG: phosphotransferase family protein [Eubacteriales bacterium]